MRVIRRAITCFGVSLSLLLVTGSLAAQQISISSPSGGTRVTPGQTITVQVTAPPNAFRAVQLIAGPEVGITAPLQQPPYVFSLTIADLIGPIKLYRARYYWTRQRRVLGTGVAGFRKSEPVTSLSVPQDPIEFDFAGDQLQLQVSGVLADGSSIHLDHSSLVSYSSANSNIATVDGTGLVTAAGPGNTTVTVSYGGQSAQVKVSVPNSVRGDLNGDGRVDQDDLNMIFGGIKHCVNYIQRRPRLESRRQD